MTTAFAQCKIMASSYLFGSSNLGPVARSMVNFKPCLRPIDIDTFLWKLTLVRANLASNNSGLLCSISVEDLAEELLP